MALELSAPQDIFLNKLGTKYRAYVGGFGSGKTYIGCLDLCIFASQHPKTVQGYFGPTFGSIRDIFYPTMSEAAESMGFRADVNTSNKEVHLYRGSWYYGTIICRSMDNPGSIVGFKVARALVDEIDTLPKSKATLAWRKIIARLRLVLPGVVNGVGVTTTPEGFLFVYDKFKKDPTESYSMVQSSTYENERYLPPDYIPSLLESYPDNVAQAYISGDFVNMQSGTVYHTFDRKLNHCDDEVKQVDKLYVGMDFNVQNMAAIVNVKRNGEPRAVDEITKALDTPAVISILKEKYPHHRIAVYPDASGKGRSTVGASTNDLSLLKLAGFEVVVNASNPPVKDRVTASNAMFCNASGKRSYLVNTKKCPDLTEALEQQAYDKFGQPDKSTGVDHPLDAMGYFIVKEYPVMKPSAAPRLRRAS